MDDYKQLFDAYVDEMREAQGVATAWWATLLAKEKKRTGSLEAAEAALDLRWPMGPVSHPAVIRTFRKWALEIQDLNDERGDEGELDEAADDEADEDSWGEDGDADEGEGEGDLAALIGPVEPLDLLIEMLPGRADDLAEFLADFVFTPLGLDADDRWV